VQNPSSFARLTSASTFIQYCDWLLTAHASKDSPLRREGEVVDKSELNGVHGAVANRRELRSLMGLCGQQGYGNEMADDVSWPIPANGSRATI
jgi:hypothetical protein